MTTSTTTTPALAATIDHAERRRTARTTGWLYLGLAVTGLVGHVLILGQLFDPDAPGQTVAKLAANEGLARVGIAMELGIVLTQALAALWFYRLFREIDSFAAVVLVASGLVNAVMILVSAAMLATALEVAGDPSLSGTGDAAATVALLYSAGGHVWGVAGIFFGLWLIPMGWLVLRSGWLPRALGWVLIAGGVGYILGAFATYLVASGSAVAVALTLPATVGELWMIGYLLFIGVRKPA